MDHHAIFKPDPVYNIYPGSTFSYTFHWYSIYINVNITTQFLFKGPWQKNPLHSIWSIGIQQTAKREIKKNMGLRVTLKPTTVPRPLSSTIVQLQKTKGLLKLDQ